MRPQNVRSLALLGSVSLAAANDVVSLILPFADEQDIVGEVIGSSGSMTTYALYCADYSDDSECGIPTDGMTVAAGPTAFVYEYQFDDYYLRQSCENSGTTWVSCEVTNSQSDFSTVTSDSTSVELPLIPVTITATATDADFDSEPTSTTKSESSATPTNSDDDDDDSSTTLSGSITVSESPSVTAQPSQTTSASRGFHAVACCWCRDGSCSCFCLNAYGSGWLCGCKGSEFEF
ncbi:putative GPI anchored glycoprotein [Aspergillus undulatus]|uniref:putative GPI anchored glycoprotein n=1 Tax=Aspergillus undulatus TaxID=1810928 RepID=UPI003CCCC477